MKLIKKQIVSECILELFAVDPVCSGIKLLTVFLLAELHDSLPVLIDVDRF